MRSARNDAATMPVSMNCPVTGWCSREMDLTTAVFCPLVPSRFAAVVMVIITSPLVKVISFSRTDTFSPARTACCRLTVISRVLPFTEVCEPLIPRLTVIGVTAGVAVIGVTAGIAVIGVTTSVAVIGVTAGIAVIGVTAGIAVIGVTTGVAVIGVTPGIAVIGVTTGVAVIGVTAGIAVIGVTTGIAVIGVTTSVAVIGVGSKGRGMINSLIEPVRNLKK